MRFRRQRVGELADVLLEAALIGEDQRGAGLRRRLRDRPRQRAMVGDADDQSDFPVKSPSAILLAAAAASAAARPCPVPVLALGRVRDRGSASDRGCPWPPPPPAPDDDGRRDGSGRRRVRWPPLLPVQRLQRELRHRARRRRPGPQAAGTWRGSASAGSRLRGRSGSSGASTGSRRHRSRLQERRRLGRAHRWLDSWASASQVRVGRRLEPHAARAVDPFNPSSTWVKSAGGCVLRRGAGTLPSLYSCSASQMPQRVRLNFIVDHRDDCVIGNAALAWTIVVQHVAGPIPAFLHATPPKTDRPPAKPHRYCVYLLCRTVIQGRTNGGATRPKYLECGKRFWADRPRAQGKREYIRRLGLPGKPRPRIRQRGANGVRIGRLRRFPDPDRWPAAVTCCFTSSPNSALACCHSSSDNDSKSRPSARRLPDHRADHLVRLAERHAAGHQVIGDVGREQQAGRGAPGARSGCSVRLRMTAAVASSETASVSSASNSGSLSSCRSLL